MFSTKGNMNKHLQKAHGVDNRNSSRSVKCPLCEKDYKTISNICEHILKEHNIQLKKETKNFDSIYGIYIIFVTLSYSNIM